MTQPLTKPSIFELSPAWGGSARIASIGASIVSLNPFPDAPQLSTVVCLPSVDDYFLNKMYLGSSVGRFANRIANGAFELDGVQYELEKNEGEHTLHGGHEPFSHRIWQTESLGPDRLRMEILSPDGDAGFPGELRASVEWDMSQESTLKITYGAECTAPTYVSMTNHAYFNLGGPEAAAADHWLKIKASRHTPVGKDLIPTGEIESVEGLPLDFRAGRPLGQALSHILGGLDHNFVIDQDLPGPVAELRHVPTGRWMTVDSKKPGLQVFSGRGLEGKPGSGLPWFGMCLEPQEHPNSPNVPEFAAQILRPGSSYRHEIVLRFGISK